jgi:DNA-binding response OmpR family regulator
MRATRRLAAVSLAEFRPVLPTAIIRRKSGGRFEGHHAGADEVTRILIAEDEARIASFIEKGLQASGLATTVVGSGIQALAMARSGEFDLMILDIGLPKLEGFTVLHALRSGSVELPVIILTARDGIDDTVAGLHGVADDYMSKPFHFDELLARVQRRLRTQAGRSGPTVSPITASAWTCTPDDSTAMATPPI